MSATTIPAALVPGRGGKIIRALVLAYAGLLVAVPLAALVFEGTRGGAASFWQAVSAPEARDALWLTMWTAGLMAIANAVMGTATAWILVRYRFPGRGIISALVDLPFAIPTLVAGLMLVLLFGPQTAIGSWLNDHGTPVAYAPMGIVLALTFVTLPFVVRAAEPVLLELDPAEEDASETLGAGAWTTFRRVVLPAILPAVGFGTMQSFARAIAEFGSIVVVSGNIPHRTLTAPVVIFGHVESGHPERAAAVSLVLLAMALLLSLGVRLLRRMTGSHHV